MERINIRVELRESLTRVDRGPLAASVSKGGSCSHQWVGWVISNLPFLLLAQSLVFYTFSGLGPPRIPDERLGRRNEHDHLSALLKKIVSLYKSPLRGWCLWCR